MHLQSTGVPQKFYFATKDGRPPQTFWSPSRFVRPRDPAPVWFLPRRTSRSPAVAGEATQKDGSQVDLRRQPQNRSSTRFAIYPVTCRPLRRYALQRHQPFDSDLDFLPGKPRFPPWVLFLRCASGYSTNLFSQSRSVKSELRFEVWTDLRLHQEHGETPRIPVEARPPFHLRSPPEVQTRPTLLDQAPPTTLQISP